MKNLSNDAKRSGAPDAKPRTRSPGREAQRSSGREAQRSPGRAAPTLLFLALTLFAAPAPAADPWEALAAAGSDKAALEKLLTEHPGFHAARFNLGTVLLPTDPAAAATQLELATAAGGAIAIDAWHNLALARAQQGRWEDALAAAEKAVALDPALAPLRDEVRRVLLARRDEARRAAEEAAKKLHLNPGSLPIARVGEAYAATLPIAGGTAPYTATVAGTSKIPEGLTLTGDQLTGMPKVAGSVELELSITDAAKAQISGKVPLTILPAPAITTERLPEAIIGQPYRASLAAVGLDAPVRWQAAPLPAGLAISADGTISGTPTAAGTVTLHCHAADAKRQANRLVDLVVSDLFAPAEDPLPPATASAPYRFRATVRGPAQEYAWSGGAPLTLAKDGTVSGTPAQPGELKLPATITAADGRSRTVDLHLTVNPAPLIDTTPIQLAAKQAVDRPVPLTGGTPPFTWAVVGGSLPAGLRLDPDGHLRGAPQDAGKTTVTLTATDAWKAVAQADLPIEITPPKDQPEQAKNDEQKPQDGQQDQQQDQGKDGKQDQAKQDPSKSDQGQQGKQDQAKSDGKDGKQDQAKSDGKDGKQDQTDPSATAAGTPDAGPQTPDPSKGISQTAAGRWLDNLPQEDRGVLRYQLLDGGQKPAESKGKAW